MARIDSPATTVASASPEPPAMPDPSRLRIVSVEDNPFYVEVIRQALHDAGVAAELCVATDEASMRACLAMEPDLILCDYTLPRFSPKAALALLEELKMRIPLIVVTGGGIGESAAVEILRLGARDYVAKDDLATLPRIMNRVLDQERARRTAEVLHARLASAHQRLKALSAHMVDVQESERKLVARELHDVLGQALTGVLMHLEAAERMPDGPAAKECRAVATRLARGSLDQIRTLSFMLRPAELDLLGLVEAVRTVADLQLRPCGVHVEVRTRGEVNAAPPVQAAVLYRVVQEALTNVARHAHARRVWINLVRTEPDRLTATVIDDGRGFDAHAALRDAGDQRHVSLGLMGMVERCELIGGYLRIRSRVGRGTAVHACL
ncbi:MAG: histidine kinase [Burkholderiales bacterium]